MEWQLCPDILIRNTLGWTQSEDNGYQAFGHFNRKRSTETCFSSSTQVMLFISTNISFSVETQWSEIIMDFMQETGRMEG